MSLEAGDVDREREDEPQGPENREDGSELPYQVLIAPFSLMALAGRQQERCIRRAARDLRLTGAGKHAIIPA